ncbi:peptidase S41 family protein [Nitzschia inconspicua]|uniref:Peptidase S41 family protein n=1 Tax=Nitzschia inconspicua TaxID=303405 RepID=A0A9K3LYY1_9STRA|nr:peptidase S41 family protein [Nitzschia inconspicua]
MNVTNDQHDLEADGGVIQMEGSPINSNNNNENDSNYPMSLNEEDDCYDDETTEHAGLMMKGPRSNYSPVRIKSRGVVQSSIGVGCQLILFLIALVLVGLFGYYLGNTRPTPYLSQSSSNDSTNQSVSNVVVSNMDSKTYSELMKEANLLTTPTSTQNKRQHMVHYNPSAVLANDPNNNPFAWNDKTVPSFVTPPKIHEEPYSNQNLQPSGYLTQPHLVNNQLVFCSEGDAYLTYLTVNGNNNGNNGDLSSLSLPSMKLTTTVGNVLNPKWHPTLPILAYTATYSGRRDVYLMDLRTSTPTSSPMRLTYWDVGIGGVSGLIGWISHNDDDDQASVDNDQPSYSLLFRAVSNEVSLPDFRLYMIHLDNHNSRTGDASAPAHPVMEIEPVPLAQATDAVLWNRCWYFVRYKQSSNTIRYVGGTAENLWKYCKDEPSSRPLFQDDDYRGTSKDPQLYRHNGSKPQQRYLFFLSDRGRGSGNQKWIPDRMNIWALPLNKNNNDNDAPLSTNDLIQITDTACDFEGRTIREYSVDAVTGNLVVRIGADLYIMSQETIQAKLNDNANRLQFRRALDDSNDNTDTDNIDIIQSEMDGDDGSAVNGEDPFKNNVTALPEEEANQPDIPAEQITLPPTFETSVATEMPTIKVPDDLSQSNIDDVTAEDAITEILFENVTEVENATEPPKYYYNYESPELVARKDAQDQNDHFSGRSSDLTRLPIKIYSDFSNLQERIVPVSIAKHFVFGDIFDTISQSTKMLLTLRGQLWVAPVVQDDVPPYGEAGRNLPARQYKVAPGVRMGGVTRILAARHVPNPAEDDLSDRRLAIVLATDPLTETAEHAFYLIEVQPGVDPLFVDTDKLPKPFLGGMVSGGSSRDGGLGSVKVDTLVVSPCGNRMAWSDTDGRIVVMNLPQYQELKDSSPQPSYVVLPQENELGEPMMGDEVVLTFSPGGRYLAIEHHARNQFEILSIADLGDPLREENKIADIEIGRIVQATPSKFNSNSAYWGKSPTDVHDFARDKKMAELFGLKEPEDVSSTLYFLSDRDILTDVRSPWGHRQKMPHFTSNQGIYAIPLKPKESNSTINGQFRGGGAEEAHVDEILERKNLLQSLLLGMSSSTKRQLRQLQDANGPLVGVFGLADQVFGDNGRERLLQEDDKEGGEDHLKSAVFQKDMDIDFGAVDLSFARTAYRLANIPEGNYVDILTQIPDDGSLLLVENIEGESGYVLNIFLADDYPSDGCDVKKFSPIMRKLGVWSMSTSREYFYLIFAPDGATRVVPNSLSGLAKLLSDLELDDSVVDAKGMHLSIWPQLEYRQMYDDAWRMLRDYFYDPDMTGINWPLIHERYLPLVERCTKREEMDDVLIQMASELSALHVFVYGGEYNSPTNGDKNLKQSNEVGSLGASLQRSPDWNGYKVMSVPMADPDYTRLDQAATVYSPLCDQTLRMSGQRGLKVGDVIVGVNGESVMRVPDIHMLLRGTAGKSVRLDVVRLASGFTNDTMEDGRNLGEDIVDAPVETLVVVPLSPDAAEDLLYRSWEWKTEQLAQELAAKAGISVGYVHLQDMSGPEAEDAFARGFFPNYHKQGFILDVRHNRGGNIDSWVLDVLQRKPWMYWQARAFNPSNGGLGWDEHYAFRGHVIVLLDEKTSSDGEGVSRGISELGLGKLIGTRTWGGGIWLASDNHLVDGGIATAPEIGTYNERLEWGLHIEQMGVDPDIVVDNDPHEAFTGKDRQLERAIEELKKWLEEEPVVLPTPPEKKKDMTMGDRECKA